MKPIATAKQSIASARNWFTKKPLLIRTGLIIIVLIVAGYGIFQLTKPKQQMPELQTAVVEKGTLTVEVTATGNVTSTSNTPVKTQSGGVVSEILAGNGTIVQAGDAIATLTLDQSSQQKASQTWASYLSAKASVDAASANQLSLQADMFGKWQSFMETAESVAYQNDDGTPKTGERAETAFTIPEREWLAAEAKYKNQQVVIQQAQAALNAAWLTYQESSGTITAPVAGTVEDLSLQVGTVIETAETSETSSGSTTTSSTKVGVINTGGNPVVTVNISEIDAPKIQVGDKATVTFDALPDKIYTGKVTSLDTSGTVSSGVTTYSTLITLDLPDESIFTNMTAEAIIVTDTVTNALLVPSSAITTTEDGSTVRVRNGRQMKIVPVKTGVSSDTHTVITSGLKEGDTVVTSSAPAQPEGAASQTQSVFGGSNRGFGGAGGGGGQERVIIRN